MVIYRGKIAGNEIWSKGGLILRRLLVFYKEQNGEKKELETKENIFIIAALSGDGL